MALERNEGVLACLGSAIVLVELVDTRVRLAVSQMPGLLSPALDDLARVKKLIRRGQGLVDAQQHTLPCPRAR